MASESCRSGTVTTAVWSDSRSSTLSGFTGLSELATKEAGSAVHWMMSIFSSLSSRTMLLIREPRTWPGAICDPGRGSAGAGPVGKRHGHGYCHRRFRDGNVFYGGGQYSAISASNGLRWVNFHSGGV